MSHKLTPMFLLILVLLVSLACKAISSGPNAGNMNNQPAVNAGPSLDDSISTEKPGAVSPGSVPEGWVVYELPQEGFSIALPSTWVGIDMSPKKMGAGIEAVREQDQALAESLTQNAQALAAMGIKFYGVNLDLDPAAGPTGFAPHINISYVQVPDEVSLEEFGQVNREQLENQEGVEKPVLLDDMILSAGPAKRISYNMTQSLPEDPDARAHFIQYLVIHRQNGYVVTITVPPDQKDKYVPIADEIAASIQWMP